MFHLHVHDARGAVRHSLRLRTRDEWKEEEHKRDDSGQFTSGGQTTKTGHGQMAKTDLHDPEARQDWINRITEQYGLPKQDLKFDPELSEADILAHASGSGISLNPDYFSNPENFTALEKKWQGMTVDPSPEGVLLHELGHKMYQNILPPAGLSNRASRKWLTEKEAILQRHFDASVPPSPYAQEHPHEWAAEAFSTAHGGKTSFNGFGYKEGQWPEFATENHQKAIEQAKALWQELYAHGDRDSSGRLKPDAKPRPY